jgi:hypothetical protein
MSLIEINDRLRKIMPRSPDWDVPVKAIVPNDSLAYEVDVAFREGDNRFSITDIAQGPHLLIYKGNLHIPLRNDFASRAWPVPWRISSNWGGPLFYGYYNETFLRKREYSLHTDRAQDFNPPLNQAELTVSETKSSGVLKVDIATFTPCFDAFVAQYDGGEWGSIAGTSLEWTLHEGLNTLKVRARNTVGVLGPESVVKVVMNR